MEEIKMILLRLLAVWIKITEFFQDDEPYDAAWMDFDAWRMTHV